MLVTLGGPRPGPLRPGAAPPGAEPARSLRARRPAGRTRPAHHCGCGPPRRPPACPAPLPAEREFRRAGDFDPVLTGLLTEPAGTAVRRRGALRFRRARLSLRLV